MWLEESIEAFYGTYRSVVVMNAPFTMVHFATYEAVKRGLMKVEPDNANDQRLVVHPIAGVAVEPLATAVTMPLDVVKT